MTSATPPPDRPDEPTAFLPSVGAALPSFDPHAPVRPAAYRDPRADSYDPLDPTTDPTTDPTAFLDPRDRCDRPPPRRRRRPAREDDDEHYPISYEGTTALVVICVLAVAALLAVVWWVGASR